MFIKSSFFEEYVNIDNIDTIAISTPSIAYYETHGIDPDIEPENLLELLKDDEVANSWGIFAKSKDRTISCIYINKNEKETKKVFDKLQDVLARNGIPVLDMGMVEKVALMKHDEDEEG